MREIAYNHDNTRVRPQLNYAAPIWELTLREKLSRLKKSKEGLHAVPTVIMISYMSSVPSMLGQLRWRYLEQRRTGACLCLFYKMIHGIVAVPLPSIRPAHTKSVPLAYCHALNDISSDPKQTGIIISTHLFHWPSSIAMPFQFVASLQDLESFNFVVNKLQHYSPKILTLLFLT